MTINQASGDANFFRGNERRYHPLTLAEYARAFATERHVGQLYDGQLYTVHLAAVERVLIDFGYTAPQWVAAAWLHDTLEDTPTTYEELRNRFGVWITARVEAVTGRGATRRERNIDILNKVRTDWRSAVLKCAGRIANVEASVNNRFGPLYVAERKEFGAAVYPLVPRPMWIRLEAAYDVVIKGVIR